MAWILNCGMCNKLGDGVSSTRSNEKEIVGVFVNLIGSFLDYGALDDLSISPKGNTITVW